MFSFNRTTNCTRGGISAMIAAIMVLAIGGAPRSATADLLYDTLGMIDGGTYNAFLDSFIGGQAVFSTPRDSQAVDDFTLNASHNITTVTGAFAGTPSNAPPAHGVLVEFFADNNGTPGSTPFAAVLSTAVSITSFTDTVFGGAPSAYVTVDLSGAGITLGAGTWWIGIQPVDETSSGAQWRQYRQTGVQNDNAVHVRNAGNPHGNGYAGTFFGNGEWLSLPLGPYAQGDLAMQIQGTLIPAPGALALLGLAGLFGGGRRRKNV